MTDDQLMATVEAKRKELHELYEAGDYSKTMDKSVELDSYVVEATRRGLSVPSKGVE